jgi:hypothetical protein
MNFTDGLINGQNYPKTRVASPVSPYELLGLPSCEGHPSL